MTPDETIEKWVRITMDEADSSDFRMGDDISPYPEIKITFDGYAEDDDGDDDDDDDESKLSFAVYIHKDADTDGFVFPEHDDVIWQVVHRPSEEVYHNVWYHREIDDFDYWFLAESVEKTEVPYERIVSVIETLEKRFSASEE